MKKIIYLTSIEEELLVFALIRFQEDEKKGLIKKVPKRAKDRFDMIMKQVNTYPLILDIPQRCQLGLILKVYLVEPLRKEYINSMKFPRKSDEVIEARKVSLNAVIRLHNKITRRSERLRCE